MCPTLRSLRPCQRDRGDRTRGKPGKTEQIAGRCVGPLVPNPARLPSRDRRHSRNPKAGRRTKAGPRLVRPGRLLGGLMEPIGTRERGEGRGHPAIPVSALPRRAPAALWLTIPEVTLRRWKQPSGKLDVRARRTGGCGTESEPDIRNVGAMEWRRDQPQHSHSPTVQYSIPPAMIQPTRV